MPDAARFWDDALLFVRGSRHRDAATSSEALTALPTAAAFLRKYSFEAVLSAVGAVLAPADASVDAPHADMDDEHEGGDDEAADDSLMRALSPAARTHFCTGCELLEKLVASAAIFSGTDSTELLLGTVLTATAIPAAALRRIAAAFYCRLARGEFTGAGAGEDPSPGGVAPAALSSRIAAAREALWAALPDGAAPGSHVAALTALLSDRDTVTAERAATALAALCGLAAPQRDSWESSARRRLQRSAGAAGAGAGAGASAASAAGGDAVAAGTLGSSSAPSDERIRAIASAIAAALAAGGDDGDDADGGAAAAAVGHFAAQRSVRLVRVAALLSSMLQPAGGSDGIADELAAGSRRDAAAGGAASAGAASGSALEAAPGAAAAAIARSRRALAERVAAAFASAGVIATIIAAAGDDSDVLTQLNILESLPALAGTEVGARALLDSGLMTGPLLEWAGIPASAAAAGGSGAGAASAGAGAGRASAPGPVPEGDPFLCTPALAALADTFAAVLATTPAPFADSGVPSASASAPASAVAALAGHLRRALVPGIFAAVARECRGGGDVDAAVRAIAACATLLAADAGAVDAFIAPEQRLHAREWLENAVSATADLRTAALGGVAIALEGAATALRRAGALTADDGGSAAASVAVDADARSSPAAGGAGAGAGSVGSATPSSPAAAAVAAEAAALSPPAAVAAESPFRRYCDLFDRLGAACGRDTVDAAIATLKKPDGPSRLAAYRLLAAACALPVPDGWGMRRVWGYTGAAAFLLDRSTESDKTGKEWKFAVVDATLRNPHCGRLGDHFLSLLRRFHGQGPYHVPLAGPEVRLAL